MTKTTALTFLKEGRVMGPTNLFVSKHPIPVQQHTPDCDDRYSGFFHLLDEHYSDEIPYDEINANAAKLTVKWPQYDGDSVVVNRSCGCPYRMVSNEEMNIEIFEDILGISISSREQTNALFQLVFDELSSEHKVEMKDTRLSFFDIKIDITKRRLLKVRLLEGLAKDVIAIVHVR